MSGDTVTVFIGHGVFKGFGYISTTVIYRSRRRVDQFAGAVYHQRAAGDTQVGKHDVVQRAVQTIRAAINAQCSRGICSNHGSSGPFGYRAGMVIVTGNRDIVINLNGEAGSAFTAIGILQADIHLQDRYRLVVLKRGFNSTGFRVVSHYMLNRFIQGQSVIRTALSQVADHNLKHRIVDVGGVTRQRIGDRIPTGNDRFTIQRGQPGGTGTQR